MMYCTVMRDNANHDRSEVLRECAAVAARHGRLLSMGVGGLLMCVVTLMTLSIAGCEGFSGGRVTKTESESAAGSRVVTGAAKHVAPAARAFSVSGVREEPDMRIRIAGGVTTATIGGGPAVSPGTGGAKHGAGVRTETVVIQSIGAKGPDTAPGFGTKVAGPVRVSAPVAGSMEWVVVDAAGQTRRFVGELLDCSAGEKTSATGSGPTASLISLDGVSYPGRLRLVPRSDTPAPSMDVVEYVPLETYLGGVVVKEMFPNWPAEAFRVQAICARSYALHERVRSATSARHYDIEASQRAQAYSGATTNARARAAVESTRGLILAYQDQVLRAYYSSSCGGRSGAARDTWPIGRGFEYNLALPIQAYVREAVCGTSSPQYTWTLSRDREELVKRFRAYGEANGMLIRKIESISAIEVLRAAPTGRPAEYKIIESGGRWFQLPAEDLRLACNTSVPGLPAIGNKDRVLSGDVAFKVKPVPGGAGGKPSGGTVEITGRGFGHGVGMCQYCTKSMADRGDDWRAMLTRFYPGADVVRAYK